MRKTEAVRTKAFHDAVNGWREAIERLWIPDSGDKGDPEWREENETKNSAVSDSSKMQSSKAWPFPESAS